jgi:hypothetical protein
MAGENGGVINNVWHRHEWLAAAKAAGGCSSWHGGVAAEIANVSQLFNNHRSAVNLHQCQLSGVS